MYNNSFNSQSKYPAIEIRQKAIEKYALACDLLEEAMGEEVYDKLLLCLSPCHPCFKDKGFRGARYKGGLAIERWILPGYTQEHAQQNLNCFGADCLSCYWSSNPHSKSQGKVRALTLAEGLWYIAAYGLTPAFRDGVLSLDVDGSLEDFFRVVDYCKSLGSTFLFARTSHGGHLIFQPDANITANTGNTILLPDGSEVTCDIQANNCKLSVWGLLRSEEWEWIPSLNRGQDEHLSPLPSEIREQLKANDLQRLYGRLGIASGLGDFTPAPAFNQNYTPSQGKSNAFERVLKAMPGERNEMFTRYIYGYATDRSDAEVWARARLYLQYADHPLTRAEVEASTRGAIAKRGARFTAPAPTFYQNMSVSQFLDFCTKSAGKEGE